MAHCKVLDKYCGFYVKIRFKNGMCVQGIMYGSNEKKHYSYSIDAYYFNWGDLLTIVKIKGWRRNG